MKLEKAFERLNEAILSCGVFADSHVVMKRLSELKTAVSVAVSDMETTERELEIANDIIAEERNCK